ncbi:hypothetical protein LOK49_LG03G01613 [Camellia lanceoleosa]|uniref:Uncharacterized protein n=1 Tax=Camellia lanceoleosa TaxID=1840588 RepID=A0ACC0I6J6_9ERIC|nr:hypothetical protein LOK49_LG03G01613 [Camellia lanceoleosa]
MTMALTRPPVVNTTCKDGKSFTYNSSINIAVAMAINGKVLLAANEKFCIKKITSMQLICIALVEKEIEERREISFHKVGISVAPPVSFQDIAASHGDSEELHGMIKTSKRDLTDREKFQHLHYLIKSLLPFVKQIHQEQTEEMEIESLIQGVESSSIKIQESICSNDGVCIGKLVFFSLL